MSQLAQVYATMQGIMARTYKALRQLQSQLNLKVLDVASSIQKGPLPEDELQMAACMAIQRLLVQRGWFRRSGIQDMQFLRSDPLCAPAGRLSICQSIRLSVYTEAPDIISVHVQAG